MVRRQARMNKKNKEMPASLHDTSWDQAHAIVQVSRCRGGVVECCSFGESLINWCGARQI